MEPVRKTGRRIFLRQGAKALAAGIGVALIPSIAHAESQVTCCPQSCSLPGGGGCPGSKVKYWCTGTCPSYCTCHSPVGCYTIPC